MSETTMKPEKREAGIYIRDVHYPFPSGVTLGEARTIFRETGVRLAELEDMDMTNPEAMAAVVWLSMHREDNRVTFDVVDTIATVRLELNNWAGSRYTDLFTLLKVDGEWKIMNKVFHLHS